MESISRRGTIKAAGLIAIAGGLGTFSTAIASCGHAPLLIGVNLAGAEFEAISGKWHWPSTDNMRYYLTKRFNVFRIPFRWDRLQPTLNGPLLESAIEGLDVLVAMASHAGAVVIFDAHDYGRRDGRIIGEPGGEATIPAFASFWGEMARRYGTNRLAWYGLMNEPHDESPQLNLAAQNAACAAIRQEGGLGKVLFSGIAYTGAHSWAGSGNASVMLGASDPHTNYAYDMHQYLDRGFGGSSPESIPGIGKTILNAAIAWARAHSKKVFLGEFAAGPNMGSQQELTSLLDVVASNRDVFLGGTYFAGGGVWGSQNTVTTDPRDPSHPVDTTQTKILTGYVNRCSI
jgi:endoglucanase